MQQREPRAQQELMRRLLFCHCLTLAGEVAVKLFRFIFISLRMPRESFVLESPRVDHIRVK